MLPRPSPRARRAFVSVSAYYIYIASTNLAGSGVSNLFNINPGLWLGVLGIVNFCGWVDSGLEVLKEGTVLLTLAVEEDVVSVVGAITDN